MNQSTATEIAQYIHDQPLVAAALGFVLLVIILRGYSKFRGRGRRVNKDDQRLFSQSQKAEGARRAGNGRCEHKHPIWFRCRRKGTHGDHIFPHSKGGTTSLSNLQMLCPKHNLAKSATVPSGMYIWRLEQRRKRYFPQGVSPKVEWVAGRSW